MKAVKISIILNKALSKSIVYDLFALGIRHIFIEMGRSSILNKNTSFTNFLKRQALVTYPIEIVSMILDESDENAVLSYIAKKYDLRSPGKGTIFSHDITVLEQHPDYRKAQEIHFKSKHSEYFFMQLAGIICVVQRGEGDKISRISLNYGASVPATTHGEGSGVRDKLGLLRITMPPEKELVNLVLSKHDTNPVMELYIEVGKLDEPGRGIAYVFPIKQGIVNTKISRSRIDQAASLEQMVSAIDALKGGMEWRKSSLEREATKRRDYLYNLSELNLICEEGRGAKLIEAAMSSGAPGATICKLRYNTLDDKLEMHRYFRENCKMIVPSSRVQAITQTLIETGCFEGDAKAILYAQPVEKAFTYRARDIK
ncbi:MAG: hypothetical protein M0Q99_04575 [Candidatus Cloacimonetes bacterium]|nr:hypothetical protein [Candidatus Cloacimonadota bacterium]HRX76239.1 hypothetical protein [Candidatus Cloacimonadota bacterium]